MKIWLVGPQGTCKRDIYRLLGADKFKLGKLFTNKPIDDISYNKYIYKYFPLETVNEVFENNSNIFIQTCLDDSENIYTGLDFAEYDENDVFVLTPEQFTAIPTQYFKDGLVVWLDGGWNWRKNNIVYDEFRYDTDPTYNYNNVEIAEKSFYKPFCKMMNELIANNKNVLYFLEESPNRVKAIIKSIALNPKIKAEFVREFSPCRSVADVLIPKAEINIK